MSYLTQSEIANNVSMYNRVAQCAASEGETDANYWTTTNNRKWASSPQWDAAWESALAGHPAEPDYDPGADEACITDQMILSTVQFMRTPPQVEPMP